MWISSFSYDGDHLLSNEQRTQTRTIACTSSTAARHDMEVTGGPKGAERRLRNLHSVAGGGGGRGKFLLIGWGSAAIILKEQNEDALHD
jgi:hypothetical protein